MSERFTPLGCAEVDDLAEEFALGLLDGAERATVVAHLEGCRTCGARVAVLAEVGEQMLLVAPAVEPPTGFEQRVIDRLGPDHIRRRRRLGRLDLRRPGRPARSGGPGGPGRPGRPGRSGRHAWRTTALAVTAAAALVMGTAALVLHYAGGDGGGPGTGTEAVPATPTTRPAEHVATLLSAHDGRDVGEVVVVGSDPQVVELDMAEWMAAVADWDTPPPGPWLLAVRRVDGSEELHVLALADDPRPRVALQAGGEGVASVAIRDGTGHVWCSAEL